MIERVWQDISYGARSLWKTPAFAVIAVLTLALGIGANTAMFSIVNGVLLRPIPYNESDRLLRLSASMPQFQEASISYPNFLDWQQRSRSFESMAAYRFENFNLTGQPNPERLQGLMASATTFPVLRVNPLVGRTFTNDEDRRGGAPVVLLTTSYWKTRFAGNASVLGRTLVLNGRLFTILGVVPSDDVLFDRISVIVPIGQWSEPLFWDRGVGMGTRAVGRLKLGISAQRAQAELDGIANALAHEYPKENKDHGIRAVSLREDVVGDARKPLLVLLGAVTFVLLIACANVANLLLARSSARKREFAVRGALGAQRSRLIQQLLTEGLLLALTGGVLALAVAWLLDRIFIARLANQLARADQIHLDPVVLAFTAATSFVASLLFGIVPALQSSRADLNETLKEGGRGRATRHGFQRALICAEVALALVLTACAGLMIRTMSRLWSIHPGFDPQQVLQFAIAGSPAVHGTPSAVRNGYQQTIDQVRSIPGVSAASVLMGAIPMGGDSELPYWVEGRPKPAEQSQMDLALFYGVSPDYLAIMRIPLLRGRFLTSQDNENSPCVVVIDQEFQRKAFPTQDPLGQRINLDLIGMQCEIVGIVGHIKQWGLDSDAAAKVHSQMYLEFRQFPDRVMDVVSSGSAFVLRVAGDPYSVVPTLKRTVNGINGNMVSFNEESMRDVIRDSLLARRFTRMLSAVFAALAMALATVGIYGVVSYFVAQSTHNIGVCMALGANARSVLGMVLRSAMRMTLLGIIIGAAVGFLVTRLMRDLLFGVTAGDPVTFGAVALLLAAVTTLASYIPARRATAIDPMAALRHE
jgi:predicted permease